MMQEKQSFAVSISSNSNSQTITPDPFRENRERELSPPLNRENHESVMTKETQTSVRKSMDKLSRHYVNAPYSMEDVINYLEKCEINEDSASSTHEIEQAIRTLEKLKNEAETKNPNILEQTIQELGRKQQALSSQLSSAEINALIDFFRKGNESIQQTIPLCFWAAKDQTMQTQDMKNGSFSVHDRIIQFFKRIYDRMGTCQPHTLGIEGLQGNHPLVGLILDKAALQDILLHCFTEATQEFLAAHPLCNQLTLIKEWAEQIEEDKPFIDGESKEEIFKLALQKFQIRGYTKDDFPNPSHYMDQWRYALPLFLARLEGLCATFERTKRSTEVWEVTPGDDTFEDHIKRLEEKAKTILIQQLKEEMILPSEYALEEEDYKNMIDEAIKQGFSWFTINHTTNTTKMQFNMHLFLFSKILMCIQEKEAFKDSSAFTIMQTIMQAQPSSRVKNELICYQAMQLYASPEEESKNLALQTLSLLGSDTQICYWLIHLHSKNNLRYEDKQNLCCLINDFFSIKRHLIQECYGVKRWIKHHGSDHLKLTTLSMNDLFLGKSKIKQATPRYGTVSLFCIAGFSIGMPLIVLGIVIDFLENLGWLSGALSFVIGPGVMLLSILAILLTVYVLYNAGLKLIELTHLLALKEETQASWNIHNCKEAFSPLSELASTWFMPYRKLEQLKADLNSPIDGIVRLLGGIALIFQSFKQNNRTSLNFLYGLTTIVRGFLDIIMIPLNYGVMIPLRGLFSLSDYLLLNKNYHIQKHSFLIREGKTKLLAQSDSKNERSAFLADIERGHNTISQDEVFDIAQRAHKKYKDIQKENPKLDIKDKKVEKQNWKQLRNAFFFDQNSSVDSSTTNKENLDFIEAAKCYFST